MSQGDTDDKQMPITFQGPGRATAPPGAPPSDATINPPRPDARAVPPPAAARPSTSAPWGRRPGPSSAPAPPAQRAGLPGARAHGLLRAALRGAGFGAILLGVAWGAGQVAVRLTREKGKVDLPRVVGMESVAAIELLKERGLVPKVVTEEYNDRVGRGRIASQQPSGAMRVKPGAEVRLIVSRGSETAAMPDLAGLSLPEAQRVVAEQGLRVGTVTEVHAGHHPPGVVIAHEPPAREAAQRGAGVHLLLNAGGSEEVGPMPNLVGEPVRAALAKLQGLGVEARLSFERAERLRDSVLRQEPPAGGSLKRGQRAILVVGQ